MKLAVSTYSLARWRSQNNKTLDETLDWIAAAGVKAVEFSGLDEKARDNPVERATQLRRHCTDLGLDVAGYCISGEFLRPPAVQRQMIDQVKSQVEVAAALGAKTMRHDVTRGWNEQTTKDLGVSPTFAHALRIIAPALREITEHAVTLGVKTSLENHGFYMQRSDRVEKLIEAVDHPNYRLTLDMGNFLCVNEDPIKAVTRLAKYATMVHVKDFHVRPKRTMPPTGWFATPTSIALRGAIVGHGVIDVPRQLRIVQKAGYRGFLSLEFEGMEEPAMAVKTGLEYLTKQLAAISALE